MMEKIIKLKKPARDIARFGVGQDNTKLPLVQEPKSFYLFGCWHGQAHLAVAHFNQALGSEPSLCYDSLMKAMPSHIARSFEIEEPQLAAAVDRSLDKLHVTWDLFEG